MEQGRSNEHPGEDGENLVRCGAMEDPSENNSRRPTSPVRCSSPSSSHLGIPPQSPNSLYDNGFMLHRMYEHAVHNVAPYAFMSLPTNSRVTLYDLTNATHSELGAYYYHALPSHRRFLLYSHYGMATDVHTPGSWHSKYCSLCGGNASFQTESEHRQHFERVHSITTPLHNHAQYYMVRTRSNLMPYIRDAYLTYVAMQSRRLPLRPFMPRRGRMANVTYRNDNLESTDDERPGPSRRM